MTADEFNRILLTQFAARGKRCLLVCPTTEKANAAWQSFPPNLPIQVVALDELASKANPHTMTFFDDIEPPQTPNSPHEPLDGP